MLIETDAKILLVTQMDGDFLQFLSNMDKLRSKYQDKFKMKTAIEEVKTETKETKDKERKYRDTKDVKNIQKLGDGAR